MIDVEADGPIPGDYSMVCFGAILVDRKLDKTFYGRMKPISEKWNPEALGISGFTREETLAFPDPLVVMNNFNEWLYKHNVGRPMFISDNNGFDWMFICWYYWHFLGVNPFGHSSTNLGSFYKGVERDFARTFKRLRKTRHSHNPVDDARGNAEAFLTILDRYHVGGCQL